jgi:hypothetical protein
MHTDTVFGEGEVRKHTAVKLGSFCKKPV